ncbi:hypothetical protein Bresa_00052|uniref:Uncharacterized protein n=1 Tax=Brenneria salicis ATCC 15712 = DSM 30166 TaxID=714314 RepID=A0A366I6T3_9GAMM|nr:hypothetical protein [Brenneria salicis]NMN90023.1 hypothetical protein [Brenneria salicis ATCC 15712 = DSM 30166]RBP64328.1 hypothetical protein DES54_10823 [Brenneria salicis ATCC 15712 = DSM 30166]RLM31449.1 hypothetical protein BHG07_05315 [Brenneria salicis ATCC 15712 = DSM 30166]
MPKSTAISLLGDRRFDLRAPIPPGHPAPCGAIARHNLTLSELHPGTGDVIRLCLTVTGRTLGM